jgi:hypothetical protein
MGIDVEKFTERLRKNAHAHSQSRCAKYLRVALEAGGAKTSGHPNDAKDWGPTLLKNGIHEVALEKAESYQPREGDIVVIQPTSKGNPAGHIQAYDGKKWISDFVQTDFWPGQTYRKERPKYVIYRP